MATGKTTTVNMITGKYTPTFGDAFVMGMDLRSQASDIQRRTGVCPQHDVLFPYLSIGTVRTRGTASMQPVDFSIFFFRGASETHRGHPRRAPLASP